MTTIRESIRRLFKPVDPLPAGAYSYKTPPDAPVQYRLHLRIEPGGSGILIINAATVLYLNLTAAEYAYGLIKEMQPDEIARRMAARYQVSRTQALVDYRDLSERIQAAVTEPDLDPETVLDFDRDAPFTHAISAPYRLDCALTYRLPPGAPPDLAPLSRVKRELTTAEWKIIIEKAWQAGIPQIIFTGGEPTLREDLFELLEFCEARQLVTGLITGSTQAGEATYLNELLQPQRGLDHLTLVFEPEKDEAWQALDRLISADLFVTVHLTVDLRDPESLEKTLEQLAEHGVKSVSLSASTVATRQELLLFALHSQAATLGMRLVWNMPVPYSAHNPIALELKLQELEVTPEGAGHAWLYVEPDGDVLPEQGINQVLGNLLTDPWEEIWFKAKNIS